MQISRESPGMYGSRGVYDARIADACLTLAETRINRFFNRPIARRPGNRYLCVRSVGEGGKRFSRRVIVVTDV